MQLEFIRDFAPDKPLSEGGGASQLTGGPANVIPAGDKIFAPFGSYTQITSSSVGAEPLGMFSFRASNGSYYTIVGIDVALKRVNGSSWDDVTRTAGGAYATVAGDKWFFTNAADRIIATNYTDDVQSYIAGTDTDFSALGGSPPKAKYCTTTDIHTVLGYINSGGTVYPSRVQWSKIGDPTTWTTSVADQSGYQDLPYRNGAITQIFGGEYITVVQERAITRGTYVGGDQIYQWDEVVSGIGCVIPSSAVKAGDLFFVARDGLKKFNGQGIVPIGHGKIDSTFWTNTNRSNLQQITAFAHPDYPVICWGWGGTVNSTNQSYVLLYNYLTDRWAYIQLETLSATKFHNLGVIYNSTYPQGAVAGFGASSRRLGSFTGTAYEGMFFTPMVMPPEDGGQNIFLRCQVISENAVPTEMRVQYPSANAASVGLISAATQTVLTASNNAQFVGRITANSFRFIAKLSPWSITNKLLAVRIIEMDETGTQ